MNLTDITRLQATVDEVARAGTASEPMTWYIARVAPLRERQALAGLVEAGISAYLPCEIRYGGPARKRERRAYALFPGYLFVAINPRQALYDVRAVDGVLGIVGQSKPLPLSPAGLWWLACLRSADMNGDFDHTRPTIKEYEKGQKLRIREDGALKGQVGAMVEMTADKRVRVMLNAALGWTKCFANDKVEAVEEAAAA